MSFKNIVVFVDASVASTQRLHVAANLARRHAAHVIGVYAVPYDIDQRAGDGFARGEGGMDEVLERQRLSRERNAQQAGRQFAEFAGLSDIRSEFRVIWNTDNDRDVIVSSLYADLAIVGQARPYGLPQHWLPEHLLLANGVPMLVVPNSWTSDTIGTRVVIAWNASREARRAVTDALPFLQVSELVTIVVIDAARTPDLHGSEPGADIALHLARHGVRVEVEQRDSDGASVDEAILGAAGRHGADLIVMGARSHGLPTQLLFGSVTRKVLENTTFPILMSH